MEEHSHNNIIMHPHRGTLLHGGSRETSLFHPNPTPSRKTYYLLTTWRGSLPNYADLQVRIATWMHGPLQVRIATWMDPSRDSTDDSTDDSTPAPQQTIRINHRKPPRAR